jgi:hypothetical protein
MKYDSLSHVKFWKKNDKLQYCIILEGTLEMRYQILTTVSSVVQHCVFGRYAPMFQKNVLQP